MIVNHMSRLMGERRLSVKDVERGTGISYNTLYDWYAGRITRYDATVLDKLCAFFGASVGDIIEYLPDSPDVDPSSDSSRDGAMS